ncbi:hypothetical protein ACFQZX_01035 [Mucilaginibacter litoreus]|uniref:Uncharacterized protein n=1 Tax=Mucilaginibacter litoreus TaxID=1048221 RepID=A0ABW3AMU5_9SPHI
MKKALIAAALVLSTGILSANVIMHRDTAIATSVTESKDNTPVVTTDFDNTHKATKKDIGTAD